MNKERAIYEKGANDMRDAIIDAFKISLMSIGNRSIRVDKIINAIELVDMDKTLFHQDKYKQGSE